MRIDLSTPAGRLGLCLAAALMLSPAPAAAGAPKYGGTFVMGLGGEPRHLNPAITVDTYVGMLTSTIFNGLVELDGDFKPIPDLARSWAITDGGRTYTFKLAPGVRWHDGKPFSSADVKFTFEAVLKQHHGRGQVVLVAGHQIETPDAETPAFSPSISTKAPTP